MLAQEGAAVVERAPVPRRRVRALDVGDDARTAVGAGERLRVLGACVEIKISRVHPTHWLISTQLGAEQGVARGAKEERGRAAPRGARHGPEVVERDAGALAHASTPNPHLACPLRFGDHGAFVKKVTQNKT